MPLDLVSLNSYGFIAGDNESLEQFENRVYLCQNSKELLESLSLDKDVEKYDSYFDKDSLVSKYDLDPNWLFVLCSNSKLMPWEAASTWIYPINNSFSYPILQFRKKLASKAKFFGYHFSEIFAHETLHAVRSNIEGDKYEEIIAFQTSKKWYRRFLGPIFRNPQESILYVVSWAITIFATALFTILQWPFLFFLFAISGLVAVGFSVFGFIRLLLCKRKFMLALKMVKKLFSTSNPNQIIIRLNDVEIEKFACESRDKVVKYIEEKALSSLKWKQILASYEVVL